MDTEIKPFINQKFEDINSKISFRADSL